MINLRYLDICLQLLKHLRQIKNTMYYNGISNGPLEGINNKIKVIKRISYGYRFFTNFKAKILLVFSIFTPTEAIKKPKYSKEEHQAILTKKKTIKLKRKNKKKLYYLIGCILNPGHGKIPAPDFNFYIQKDKYPI